MYSRRKKIKVDVLYLTIFLLYRNFLTLSVLPLYLTSVLSSHHLEILFEKLGVLTIIFIL